MVSQSLPVQITAEVVGTLLAALIIYCFKLAREVRDSFVTMKADVANMKTNHIPHLYHLVKLICKKLNIEVEENVEDNHRMVSR